MSRDSLRDTFFAECEDLIESLTEGLNTVASGAWDSETINAIFRAVHSIKGASGAFGFSDLVTFAHAYETVLDLIRSDRLDITPEVLRLITRSSDALAELVDTTRHAGAASLAPFADLIDELERTAGVVTDTSGPEPDFVFAPMALLPIGVPALSLPEDSAPRGRVIRFRPSGTFYANGHEPGRFITALESLGPVEVACATGDIPPLDAFDHDTGYLAWTVTLDADVDEAAIRTVFAFASGLCDLEIDPAEPLSADLPPLATTADLAPAQPVNALDNAPVSIPVSTPETPAPAEPPSPAPATTRPRWKR